MSKKLLSVFIAGCLIFTVVCPAAAKIWDFGADNLPNDTFFDKQWSLNNIGQRVRLQDGVEDVDMDLPEAWNYVSENFDSISEVVVAVLDSGVNYNHVDLRDNILMDANGNVKGYDFVNGDSDPMDDNGHGTIIAGVIAAKKNNFRGIAGINDYVKIMPVKVLDETGNGNLGSLGEGILYAADNGADVINLSLVGDYDSSLDEAITYAFSKGVIIVCASGGDDINLGLGNLKSPISNDNSAEKNQIIGVSAINSIGERYSGSNYGEVVDISAPGASVISTYYRTDRSYIYASGTSLATANVSGVVSLIKSCYPNLSNEEITNVVIDSAKSFSSSMDGMGAGMINAYNALEYVEGTPENPIEDPIEDPETAQLVRLKDDPTVYYIDNGTKRGISRIEVFEAWGLSFDDVEVLETQAELDQYSTGRILGFPAGWVVKGSELTVFEIQENEIARPFTTPDAFLSRGHNWEDIIEVADDEIFQAYDIGAPITE